VPDGTTRFDDLVHGPIAFDNANIEDFVVLRSDGYPTYHLSVVADDLDMRITHVVRGDDHISNTPKHVLLFAAFGVPTPAFGHVPLILGTDRKRLSKRHGATSVTEYARQGYLPEAMVNFLALLGWSPGTDQEIFTKDELIAAFSVEGISGGNAVFNPEKLDWMNAQHLLRLSPVDLVRRVRPELEDAGLWSDALQGARRGWFERLLALLLPRVKRLGEFAAQAAPFLGEVDGYDPAAVAKHLGSPGMTDHVRAFADVYRTLDPFDEPSTEATLRALAESRGVKFGALVHATRIALTGRAVSPGLFETLVLIGRERSVRRLDALAAFLAADGARLASPP
jgi:glutamyl-tRNA synthetase